MTQTDHLRAAGADCSPGDGCDHSGGVDEWDASPDEGVLGSDVGGLFQEPLEMVQETITLAPGFTVEASVARVKLFVTLPSYTCHLDCPAVDEQVKYRI